MGLKPITLLNVTWGSRRSLLNQDLDNYVPDHVLNRLVEGTGVPRARLIETTLAEYQGSLYVNHNAKGRNPWLLPTTTISNDRLRHGLQFCPDCLRTDTVPYFRRVWRLAFVTVCTTHGTLLRDRCPDCGEPVHQHRAMSPRHCYSCGANLCSRSEDERRPLDLRHDFLTWQASLESGVRTGWLALGGRITASTVVFAIIRQVAALMVNGPRSAVLRSTAASLLGGDGRGFDKPTRRQPIEYLTVDERFRLFDLVQRMMTGWPIRFVDTMQQAGLHRSHAMKDMPDPPFAFEQVLRDYLDSRTYFSSDEEVAAAAAWLRRTRGRATYADLKKLCRENRRAIYANVDFVRAHPRPSRRRVTRAPATPDPEMPSSAT